MRLSIILTILLYLVPSYTSISYVSAQDEIRQTDIAIAYITFDGDLFISDVDGSNQVKVSSSNRFLRDTYKPQWSPDGNNLAFFSLWCGEGWAICVVDETGENVQVIIDDLDDPLSFQWSPDNQLIAYSSRSANGTADVYIVNRDGIILQSLVDCSGCSSSVISWSPDGEKLAIRSSRTNDITHRVISNIYVINRDGSNLHQISNCEDYCSDYNPVVWSPDSTQLVFTTHKMFKGVQTYLVNVNDGNEWVIAFNSNNPIVWSTDSSLIGVIGDYGIRIFGKDMCVIYSDNISWAGYHPVLSPDHSQIVYTAHTTQIYVRNLDGSGDRQLTFIEHPAGFVSSVIDPAWSPDAKHIAYLSTHGGWRALYVINSDGSNNHQLANEVSWFAWQPSLN